MKMEQDTTSRNGNGSSISQKQLILMCGHPGAGKTTTAHRIRQALDDAIVMSRDYFRNPYRGNGCLEEFSNGAATIVDRRFYAGVEQLLSIHTTVILDATFRESIKRQTALYFAQKHNCQSFIIECICNYKVLRSRLRQQMRSGQKSFIKPTEDVLEFYIKNTQEPENELNSASFIRLDTEKNRIVWKLLQNQSCEFVKQLIEVLQQPFYSSYLEPFARTFSQLSQSNSQLLSMNYLKH